MIDTRLPRRERIEWTCFWAAATHLKIGNFLSKKCGDPQGYIISFDRICTEKT